MKRLINKIKIFLMKKQEGIGVIEIILILVIIIALVLIFRDQIKAIVDKAFIAINGDSNNIITGAE